MNDLLTHLVTVLLGFFAIMNPIANTPIFLGLTAGQDSATRKLVARNALLLTFALVAVFCLLGKVIFEMFGISLPAFRITGGVLVALIGYNMLEGEQSSAHSAPAEGGEESLKSQLSIAVTPLAIPILAGPGTLASAINFSAEEGTFPILVTITAFGILSLVTYFCFVFGQGMVRFLGDNGMNIITRLMGLILAVIGVQMLLDGIKGAFGLS